MARSAKPRSAQDILNDVHNDTDDRLYVESAGDVAHDGADSGNPVKIGGKAASSLPTAVAGDDRVNTLFDVHGRIIRAPGFTPGQSEVKTTRFATSSDSSSRATILDPTSGKKARILGIVLNMGSTTEVGLEFYFGTGANIASNAGSEILEKPIDSQVETEHFQYFGEHGPVGSADEVVSIRTSADISNNLTGVLYYREE